MNIVHITLDEKFINSANNQFSSFNYSSTFYILLPKKNQKLKYVEKRENIVIVYPSFSNLIKLAKSIKNSVVIFHGLSFKAAIIHKLMNNSNTFIWLLWGAEFFTNTVMFKDQNVFYDKLTLKLKNEINKKKYFAKVILNSVIYFKHQLIYNSILNMNFVGLPFDEQLNELMYKTDRSFKSINFMYYPIDFTVQNTTQKVESKNILVGNSSSETNNHLEVFRILKEKNIVDRSIICPLSYGNIKYREKIIQNGNLLFDHRFIPLVDFLTLDEYNKIIKSCSIAIMNHKRQQAFGNIISLIYLGTKVYLHNQNPIFLFLKRIGVVIFSIEDDLLSDRKDVFDELLISEKEINKKIIYDSYNALTLKESLSQSLELIKLENGY